MSDVGKLLSSLRAEGRVDSDGRFTLDRAQARNKLRQFQLDEPRRYVVELVEAAIRKGATRIRFDIDADDMHMRFNGEPFTVEDFEHVYGSLFAADDTDAARARAQLAVGLNAAMALNPRHARVRSGDGKGATLQMRPGEPDEYGPADGPGETHIHVKDRMRPGLLVRFARNLQGTLAEELFLRAKCRYASIEIDLEGNAIAKGLHLAGDDVVGTYQFRAPGIRAVAGLHMEAPKRGVVHLVTGGVLVKTLTLDTVPVGFEAVIEAVNLRKDLSRGDVLQDKAYASALAYAHGAVGAVLVKAIQQHGTDPLFRERLRNLVEHELDRFRDLATLDDRPPTLRKLLHECPVFPTADGTHRSLDDCLAEIRRRGDVACSEKWFKGIDTAEGFAFVLDFSERRRVRILNTLLQGKLVDVTSELAKASRRRAARRAFSSRRARPALRDGTWLARAEFDDGTFVGEVGIRPEIPGMPTIDFIREGCLIRGKRVRDLPGLAGVAAVVQGPFSINEDFNDVLPSAEIREATAAIVATVPQLIAQMVTEPSWSLLRDRGPRQVLRYLAAATDPWLLRRVWRRLGSEPAKDARFGQPVVDPADIAAGRVPEFAELYTVPLVAAAAGTYLSLQTIARTIERDGSIRAVTTKVASGPWTHGFVLRPDEDTLAWLRTLFGTAIVDGTAEYLADQRLQRFLRKPKVRPRLHTPTALKVALEGDGISGELGLPRTFRLSQAGATTSTLIVHRERKLAVEAIRCPVGPLVAVVHADAITPNTKYDGVANDKSLEPIARAIGEGAGRLLGQLLVRSEAESIMTRTRAAVLAAVLTLFGESPELDVPQAAIDACLAGLRHELGHRAVDRVLECLVFRRTGRRGVTLGEIVAIAKRQSKVRYTTDDPGRIELPEPVLVLDIREIEFLRRFLSEGILVAADKMIERARQRAALAAKAPKIDQLQLRSEHAIATVPLRSSLMRGEVGLSADPNALQRPGVLLACIESRAIAHLAVLPPGMVAVVDDSRLTPMNEFTAIAQDDNLERVVKACEGQRAALLRDAAQQAQELSLDRERLLWRHVVKWLDSAWLEVQPQQRERVFGAVLDLPGWRRSDGTSLTVREASSAPESELEFIEITEDLDVPAERPPLVVEAWEQQLLQRIRPRAKNVSHRWRWRATWVERRDDAPSIPTPGELPGLCRRTFQRDGFVGELVIPIDADDPGTLVFGRDGREIAQRPLSTTWRCSGFVSGPSVSLEHVTSGLVVLTVAQLAVLEEVAARLYLDLLDQDDTSGRPHLRELYDALQRQPPDSEDAAAVHELHERLQRTPWIARAQGENSAASSTSDAPARGEAHLSISVQSLLREVARLVPPGVGESLLQSRVWLGHHDVLVYADPRADRIEIGIRHPVVEALSHRHVETGQAAAFVLCNLHRAAAPELPLLAFHHALLDVIVGSRATESADVAPPPIPGPPPPPVPSVEAD